MFPSLVNCCTIDWFREWPMEALRSVAVSFFTDVELDSAANPHLLQVGAFPSHPSPHCGQPAPAAGRGPPPPLPPSPLSSDNSADPNLQIRTCCRFWVPLGADPSLTPF